MTALIISSITAYAGDIPESLLGSEDAQVFFGTVLNKNDTAMTIAQTKKVKGKYSENALYTYTDYMLFGGDTKDIEEGKTYLCGYLNANNPLYMWETTSTDTATLKIRNKTGGGMEERMEEYLNNGDFGDRDGAEPELDDEHSEHNAEKRSHAKGNVGIAVGGLGLVVAIAAFCYYQGRSIAGKRKKK